MTFAPGTRVETLSGQTKGTILEIHEDGHLDIQGDTGNRYRNCIPSMWRQSVTILKPAAPRNLTRGDPVHIIYKIDAEYFQRNGHVKGTTATDICVLFEDTDAAWCSRAFVVRGHGGNPL